MRRVRGASVALATSLGGLVPAIVEYLAVCGWISHQSLLTRGSTPTALGDAPARGINRDGVFVRGASNETPSQIKVNGIWGRRFVIYPLDQVLLPPLLSDAALRC